MSRAPRAKKTVIVMGVCGCGKTSFGKTLVETLTDRLSERSLDGAAALPGGSLNEFKGVFIEGDKLHPKSNIEKMSNGVPLSDEDRLPWLESIREHCDEELARPDTEMVVVACSALRKNYRDLLRKNQGETWFVHLRGDKETIRARMADRDGHFMPESLIDSQFAALEDPKLDTSVEANVIELDIRESLAALCDTAMERLIYGEPVSASDVDLRRQPHLGLIGLGVMGQNLAVNIANNGYGLQSWDYTKALRDAYIAKIEEQNKDQLACHETMEALVQNTVSPRSIMLMIKAGSVVDEVMAELLPMLDPGDIVVDLGNSHYQSTDKRCKFAERYGVRFVGCGTSGGAKGARNGPSLMPGGDQVAAQLLQGFFQDIAAEYEGEPCVSWMGPEGAGHFVKMVHNGIEYADMQLISEAYHVMRDGLGMASAEIAATFKTWNEGPLGSYLIQATSEIFTVTEADGVALVERILDRAGQKGTGGWAVASALDTAVPATQISDAVFARIVSSLKTDRVRYAGIYPCDHPASGEDVSDKEKQRIIHCLGEALYGAKVINYIQGFMLMSSVSKDREWHLDFMKIASIWRAGCIIRGALLNDIVAAYREDPQADLLEAEQFQQVLNANHGSMREVIKFAIDRALPLTNFSGALTFFDSMRSASLPANLIQAQRDYFGAHRFERIDGAGHGGHRGDIGDKRGELIHVDWEKLVQEAQAAEVAKNSK